MYIGVVGVDLDWCFEDCLERALSFIVTIQRTSLLKIETEINLVWSSSRTIPV